MGGGNSANPSYDPTQQCAGVFTYLVFEIKVPCFNSHIPAWTEQLLCNQLWNREHPDCKFTAKGCTVLWDNGSSLRVSTALTMVSAT